LWRRCVPIEAPFDAPCRRQISNPPKLTARGITAEVCALTPPGQGKMNGVTSNGIFSRFGYGAHRPPPPPLGLQHFESLVAHGSLLSGPAERTRDLTLGRGLRMRRPLASAVSACLSAEVVSSVKLTGRDHPVAADQFGMSFFCCRSQGIGKKLRAVAVACTASL